MTTSANTESGNLPRPEYPRPILRRDRWLNLNGQWDFAQDPKRVGSNAGWQNRVDWPGSIIVPFAPGTQASCCSIDPDVEHVWYHRTFDNPNWYDEEVLLNIGACDYITNVYLNGHMIGSHSGGYSPIRINITAALADGENHLVIAVKDSGSWQQSRGKQAGDTRWPIDYDAVIGIWQTVWLEPVNKVHIQSLNYAFEMSSRNLSLTIDLSESFDGEVRIAVTKNKESTTQASAKDVESLGRSVNTEEYTISQLCQQRSEIKASIHISTPLLWSADCPELYDVTVRLLTAEGENIDIVSSYTGLREVTVEDGKLQINGMPVYLRGVLDQGYFPQGWYTPVDDAAMREDIQLTKSLGFNLVRKHQKAEDPRYLYWADRLGLMVWSEMPSGRIFSNSLVESLTREWAALVRRDQAHPCIICWVPFNESWGVWHQTSRPQQRAFVDGIYHLTKTLDETRPVVANDGWEFSSGDLWTLHLYDSAGGDLSSRLSQLQSDPYSKVSDAQDSRVATLPDADPTGLPILLTECGGVGFTAQVQQEEHFAYGTWPVNQAELLARVTDLGQGLSDLNALQGFVWTQLTDVQQEINGLLYFNRQPKLPIDQLKQIFSSIGESD